MNCQGTFAASAMLYPIPGDDPEQDQWEPHPALDEDSQDDRNSVFGSGRLPLFGIG